MDAIKKFYKSHNIAIFLFCFIALYSIFISEGKIEGIGLNALSFHAVDFSMGFCSKLLVGQIYNVFFDIVTERNVMILEIIFLIGFFVTISFLLETLIKKTEPEYKKNVFIAVMFFITGPCTFSLITKVIGMLDSYWLFACAFFFLFLSNKKLYIFIIPLVIGTVMIHFATIFCYVPFFVIIMLYKISCCEDKTERNYLWTIVVLSSITAIALALYLMMFEQSNVTYTHEQFKEVMASRGIEDTLYYDYGLYRGGPYMNDNEYAEYLQYQYNADGTVSENFGSLVLLQIKLTLSNLYFLNDILPFMLISPILCFIYNFFFRIFKANKTNKVKRFSLFCMAVLFWFTYVIGKLTSFDNLRWIIHSFIPIFISVLYILYIEKNEVIGTFSKLVDKYPKKMLMTYLLVYGVIVLEPYM